MYKMLFIYCILYNIVYNSSEEREWIMKIIQKARDFYFQGSQF